MKQTFIGVALSTLLYALCLPAQAQQPKRRSLAIGFLSVQVRPTPTSPNPLADAFRQGLRDLGYIEGKNILVEYRYAEGKDDLILSHVAELVQIKVDVILITSLPQIRAAKQATKTIPIVMVTTVDPVATGLIDSLARPGGNITGLTRLTRDLSGKTAGIASRRWFRAISRVASPWGSRTSRQRLLLSKSMRRRRAH